MSARHTALSPADAEEREETRAKMMAAALIGTATGLVVGTVGALFLIHLP